MRDTIRRRRADFEAAAAARLKEITIPDPSESSESDGSPATPTSSRSISPEPEPEEAPSRRRRAPVSDPSDYWDPRNLPTKHVQRRTTKQVKQLDIAVFNSAVQDVLVQDKWDLGRVLVEWDAIKIKRQEEESGNEVAATPAPVTISSDSDDDDEEEEEEEEEGEEAYETAAPSTPSPFKPSVQRSIPTSNFVSSMARWPLARTDLPPSQFLFAEELSALVSKNIRRLSSSSAHAPSPKTRKRKKTQSAYSQAGPLCSSGEIDSDETSSDEGSEENLGSDDDDLAPGDRLPEHQKLIARLSDAADDVLSSLAALVPPGPLPPQTLWEQTRRDNQNIKHDDKGLGFGWEMVVAVVKQSGKVPEGVVKVLQKRLEMIYGESAIPVPVRPTSRLDLFDRIKKPARRAPSEKKLPRKQPSRKKQKVTSSNGDSGEADSDSPAAEAPQQEEQEQVMNATFQDMDPTAALPFPHLAFENLPGFT